MKIYLFCNAGMSTSLVGSFAKKSLEKRGYNVEVEAFDMSMLPEVGEEADIIILGPQIAWQYDSVKETYSNKVVFVLTMQEFGSMNGDVIADRIEKEMKEGGIEYEIK